MKNQFATWRQAMSLRDTPQFRLFLLFCFWSVAFAAMWLVTSELPPEIIKLSAFDSLLQLQDMPASWVTIAVMLIAWCLMPFWSEEKLQCLLRFVNQYIRFIVVASFVFYALLAYFVHLRFPLSMDEYCLYFQSNVFASGKLAGKIPPELVDYYIFRPFQAGFFTVNHQEGWILSGYWPGTSLLMAPFSLLGITWLYNPVISSLTILALHGIVKRWSGSEEASAWAVLFALAAPVVAISAASFYAMPSHLLANLLFFGLLIRDDRKAAFGAGALGGFALTLHNPVPHFAFALPWILYVWRYRRELLFPLLVGYCIFGITLGIGWVACLSWLSASEIAPVGQETNGILASIPHVFSIPDAAVIANRISGMVKLLLWASPGLVVFAFLSWKNHGEPRLRVLTLSLLTTFLIYMGVRFDQGHGWGFRYLHSAWFVLPIVAGMALSADVTGKNEMASKERTFIARFMSLCALLTFFTLLPLFAATTKAYVQHRMSQLPSSPEGQRSILFINPKHGNYNWDLAHNDPFLRNEAWRFTAQDATSNAKIARKYLKNEKQLLRGGWGELWVERNPGDRNNRPLR